MAKNSSLGLVIYQKICDLFKFSLVFLNDMHHVLSILKDRNYGKLYIY